MNNTIGQLDVLNCGKGHLQIKFDKANEEDRDKARRVIRDMLKRGYALFVEIGGQLHRVKDFDPERDEYILKDPAEIEGNEPENQSKEVPAADDGTPAPAEETPKRKRSDVRRASMRTHRATGIAPTAGG